MIKINVQFIILALSMRVALLAVCEYEKLYTMCEVSHSNKFTSDMTRQQHSQGSERHYSCSGISHGKEQGIDCN